MFLTVIVFHDNRLTSSAGWLEEEFYHHWRQPILWLFRPLAVHLPEGTQQNKVRKEVGISCIFSHGHCGVGGCVSCCCTSWHLSFLWAQMLCVCIRYRYCVVTDGLLLYMESLCAALVPVFIPYFLKLWYGLRWRNREAFEEQCIESWVREISCSVGQLGIKEIIRLPLNHGLIN